MKAALNINTAMTDVFRAFAGDSAAQADMLANTVYTAAYHVMLANNKTQFNQLLADAKLYGADDSLKAIKESLGVKNVNATVKHFQRTYAALAIALDACGVPSMVADVPQGKSEPIRAQQFAILDAPAQDYAAEFTSVFFFNLTAPAQTEAEKETAKKERAVKKAAKEKAAKKEFEQTIKTEAEKLADARIVTIQDMVAIVADALRMGQLSSDLEAMIMEASQARELETLAARVVADLKIETVPA